MAWRSPVPPMRSLALLTLLFSLLLFLFLFLSLFSTFSPLGSSISARSSAGNAASIRIRQPAIPLPGLAALFPPPNTTAAPAFLSWSGMRRLLARPDMLPSTEEAVLSAASVVSSLVASSAEDYTGKECRYSSFGDGGAMRMPCGMVVDSAVTVIGVVDSDEGAGAGARWFAVELRSEVAAEVVLSCNISVGNNGEGLVIAQNAMARGGSWEEWEVCPAPRRGSNSTAKESMSFAASKVDGLVRCNEQWMQSLLLNDSDSSNGTLSNSNNQPDGSALLGAGTSIVEDHPFTATLWTGVEGFHLTINGRHETSFAYKERLDPWLATEARVFGNLHLLALMANGLPVSEKLDVASDVELIRAPPLSKKRILLLIGVSSTGNNFKRRMALRRSWMQYEAVRSGDVAVRFFTGLHKSEQVNRELSREAQNYGDIQLMPFVDYYSIVTLKTIAICTFGTRVLPAKYIMKTDDDAFVRVDEIVSILKKHGPQGLFYGLISFKSAPDRDQNSKWYISQKEWPTEMYPPWAHGPGYIISRDIAKFIVKGHQEQTLPLFKLEDVAMGIWVQEYKNSGQEVKYVSDYRFHNTGCEGDYVLAHYQSPRLLMCLWEKLQKQHTPICCE